MRPNESGILEKPGLTLGTEFHLLGNAIRKSKGRVILTDVMDAAALASLLIMGVCRKQHNLPRTLSSPQTTSKSIGIQTYLLPDDAFQP